MELQRINNRGGYLVYSYAFMDVKTAVSHGCALTTGNLMLALITFRVATTGTSGLNLTACKAKDARGAPLICETFDGVIEGSNLFPGDLNSDGIVDISDAILTSNSYGSSRGDPE
jgi:hypothetical protein